MASLRERLAGLSATRSPTGSPSNGPAPLASSSVRSLGRGFSVDDKIFPLAARPWLPRLADADPQAASLLLWPPEENIPPIDQWLFLDLETTGLAGGTGTYAFLVGLGQFTRQGYSVRQFFLRDLAAESALLAELLPLFREVKLLVTYNGKQFDAPLLETRFRLARLDASPAPAVHLDLLYPARRLWKLRWGSLRLLDLEQNLFGYARPADVPGALIPGLYFDFLRRGDDRPLEAVFRHNTDDLVTLAALAARVLHLLARPEAAGDPLELFALGRLFERARRLDRARALYELALASALPDKFDRAARYRLALVCKRQRDYIHAATLWRELVASENGNAHAGSLEVCKELAICYEHRLDDPEAAVEVTRRALAEVEQLLLLEGKNRPRHRRAQQEFARRLARLTRAPNRLGNVPEDFFREGTTPVVP